jgi:signal transduction histidine kinase/AmiR/NasT family two-component response regulator
MFVTHYLELPGYKTNIVFDQSLQTLFGVNKNEEALCSIIDKSLKVIDTDGISERWMRKTYDYRLKVAEARLPWLVGAVVMALCVVALVIVLSLRVRQQGRHLEDQVRIRTAELYAVIDNYKGVIWSVDSEKNITTFGGQYLKKIGLNPSFLLGKNLEAARRKKRHLDIIENVDKTFREGAQDWISEIDGSLFHTNTTPVYNTAGNVIGVVGSNDDLTELITLQQNLEIAVEEAQAASRAKSSFLATMSHEMRTPMSAIIGMTTIGKNSTDKERKDYALNKVEEAAAHLLNVINDVLDLSKIEANKLELSFVEFDFEKMLQKIVNIINFRMDEKNQKFSLNVDRNIPRFVVGDDHRLTQVILNLLSNAAKFSPEQGEIGLDINLSGETEGICELRITVSDNGIGISAEQQTKLFRAFEQADSGITRRFGGTGLGLSISKHIIDLMDGAIWVESEIGKGSCFIFTVKVERGRGDNAADTAEGAEISTAGKFNGKKCLVVEDVEINQEIIISILEETGLNIDCANNGQEAVDMTASDPDKYDVILMDIQMPEMNGLEAARQIRALTAARSEHLPIIAMTAHVFKSDIEECLDAGMDDHIGKPFDADDLLKKLNKYLFTLKFRIGQEMEKGRGNAKD